MQDPVLDNVIAWRIQLFGALVVERPTGERITLSVKKAAELLAFLALTPGQAHRREKLISVLWEDTDIGSARTRLRQEILKLRTQFGAETDRFPLLLITSDDLQVQPGTQIDAFRFLTACAAAKQAADWEEKRRLYAEIRSLYAADLLVEYDAPWILAERARMSGLYEQSLRDCAEQNRRRRMYAETEEALQCLLAHSPGWEESHIALMRLFAEQGQPGRVQDQYVAMQRMLREKDGTVPDEALRRLAESLRADASRQAVGRPSPTLLPASEASAQQNGAEAPSVGQGSEFTVAFVAPPVHPLPPSLPLGPAPMASGPMSRHPRRRLAALFVILCAPLFLWMWRFSHRPSGPPRLLRHQEKWTYVYEPRPGDEMPNAAGTAVAVGRTGIYITGFIDTEKDDTDILTIKLGFDGKPQWVDRYSSPEHDCDRAYSISARRDENSIYVGGETYVPDLPGVPGGWYLTLLRYESDGPKGKRWMRRSPVAVQHGQRMQVCSDRQEGAYFAGTALIGDRQEILLLHYDNKGRLIWKQTVAPPMPRTCV